MLYVCKVAPFWKLAFLIRTSRNASHTNPRNRGCYFGRATWHLLRKHKNDVLVPDIPEKESNDATHFATFQTVVPLMTPLFFAMPRLIVPQRCPRQPSLCWQTTVYFDALHPVARACEYSSLEHTHTHTSTQQKQEAASPHPYSPVLPFSDSSSALLSKADSKVICLSSKTMRQTPLYLESHSTLVPPPDSDPSFSTIRVAQYSPPTSGKGSTT